MVGWEMARTPRQPVGLGEKEELQSLREIVIVEIKHQSVSVCIPCRHSQPLQGEMMEGTGLSPFCLLFSPCCIDGICSLDEEQDWRPTLWAGRQHVWPWGFEAPCPIPRAWVLHRAIDNERSDFVLKRGLPAPIGGRALGNGRTYRIQNTLSKERF